RMTQRLRGAAPSTATTCSSTSWTSARSTATCGRPTPRTPPRRPSTRPWWPRSPSTASQPERTTHMSTLIAHSPKFQSKLVTLGQLAALPPPVALGSRHKPVPHHELVGTILEVADKAGLKVSREQYALGKGGAALFGVLDFEGDNAERSTSLGFRNSTNQDMALRAVAGSHVFVCDNLALSGEFESWSRMNTTGLNLASVITEGFAKFQKQSEDFDASVKRLSEVAVSDDEAKARMWDVFSKGILP